MNLCLPPHITEIFDILNKNNFEIYIVGGALRDIILGKKVSDYDFATNALPEQLEKIFFDRKILDVGRKFLCLAVETQNGFVEITTFREETEYKDLRKPEKLNPATSLLKDLSRRDFTINAIAYNPNTGIVDPFLGQIDIENKVIKAVGCASERFSEDALRILRALRFSAVLGFSIEQKTFEAALNCKDNVRQLSSERIKSELEKFIVAKDAGRYLLEQKEIWFEVIPELRVCDGFDQHSDNHCFDVLSHIAAAIDAVEPKLNLRLAALFHDIAKPCCMTINERNQGRFYGHMEKSAEVAKQVLTRLRFDKKLIKNVCELISLHNLSKRDCDIYAKTWIMKSSREDVLDLVELIRADCVAHAPGYHDRLETLSGLKKRIEAMLDGDYCFFKNELNIDGNDIMAIGVEAGCDIEKIKECLLQQVAFEQLENEKSVLIEKARHIVNMQMF